MSIGFQFYILLSSPLQALIDEAMEANTIKFPDAGKLFGKGMRTEQSGFRNNNLKQAAAVSAGAPAAAPTLIPSSSAIINRSSAGAPFALPAPSDVSPSAAAPLCGRVPDLSPDASDNPVIRKALTKRSLSSTAAVLPLAIQPPDLQQPEAAAAPDTVATSNDTPPCPEAKRHRTSGPRAAAATRVGTDGGANSSPREVAPLAPAPVISVGPRNVRGGGRRQLPSSGHQSRPSPPSSQQRDAGSVKQNDACIAATLPKPGGTDGGRASLSVAEVAPPDKSAVVGDGDVTDATAPTAATAPPPPALPSVKSRGEPDMRPDFMSRCLSHLRLQYGYTGDLAGWSHRASYRPGKGWDMYFFQEGSEVGKDVKTKGYQRVALKLGLTKRSSAAIAAASDDTRPVETGSDITSSAVAAAAGLLALSSPAANAALESSPYHDPAPPPSFLPQVSDCGGVTPTRPASASSALVSGATLLQRAAEILSMTGFGASRAGEQQQQQQRYVVGDGHGSAACNMWPQQQGHDNEQQASAAQAQDRLIAADPTPRELPLELTEEGMQPPAKRRRGRNAVTRD